MVFIFALYARTTQDCYDFVRSDKTFAVIFSETLCSVNFTLNTLNDLKDLRACIFTKGTFSPGSQSIRFQ